MAVRITAEQVGIDNLGELTMIPRWPGGPKNGSRLAHTALVYTIYTVPSFVLRDHLSAEGLRPIEDFRRELIAQSMADITLEEYYRSLAESPGFVSIPPAVRNRLVRVVEKSRDQFPSGYSSGSIYNSGGTGMDWTYNPPVGEELSEIHRYMLDFVLRRSKR